MDSDENKFKCAVCGRPTLMCCSACKQVFYCSAKHQEEHWELHGSECVFEETPVKKPPEEVEEDEQAFQPDPNTSLLADEAVYHTRFAVRKEVMVLLCQGNVTAALDQIKPHYHRTLSEYDRNRFFDVYELLADGLLYSKVLISSDELVPARQVLLQLYTRMVQHESTHNAAPQSTFRTDEAKGEKVTLTFAGLKKKLMAYAAIATLFCVCGDFVNGEKVYVQYVKVIEVQFGPSSLESSNAYFFLGLFYQEQAYPSRAIASFRRSMEIRIESLGTDHETVSDCLYNIGLVHKQTGSWHKATEQLLKAMKIREKNTSLHSLPVAQVLEALGKVYMATKDYKMAFDRLTQCYNIRKRLLKNPENEEIERVKTVLMRLSQKLDEEMEKDQARRVEMSLMNPIETPDVSPQKRESVRRPPQQLEARPSEHYSPPSASFEAEDSPTTPGVTLLYSYTQRAAAIPSPPSPSGLPGKSHAGLEEMDESMGSEGK